MLREDIETQIKKICPAITENKSECKFAPHGGLMGFIDTSGEFNGTRGIAFFSDRMFIDTDGVLREIVYKKIKELRIISSFEDSFADELSVVGDSFELRISDYSLDKSELKQLLEELCKEQKQTEVRRINQAEKYAEIIAQKLAENDFYSNDTENEKPVIAETVIDIPETRTSLPKDYNPTPIPEEKINWISGANNKKAKSDFVLEKRPENAVNEKSQENERIKPLEVMSGVVDRAPVIEIAKTVETKVVPQNEQTENGENRDSLPENVKDDELSEKEIRKQIGNMEPDEMMDFLSSTLSEINDDSEPFDESIEETENTLDKLPKAESNTAENNSSAQIAENEPAKAEKSVSPPKQWGKLTEEPLWGDIYIKASKKLRELCESGKLTMSQMETEIKLHLLEAAELFEKVTRDERAIPKAMLAKITELKAAVGNIDYYFGCGEDIAVRVMFFMLYQMLSYSDRIAQSPETKDKLNDYFRRFGPAGITLSMLDMRV